MQNAQKECNMSRDGLNPDSSLRLNDGRTEEQKNLNCPGSTEINLNTEKSPGELMRVADTQALMKTNKYNHFFILFKFSEE